LEVHALPRRGSQTVGVTNHVSPRGGAWAVTVVGQDFDGLDDLHACDDGVGGGDGGYDIPCHAYG